MQNSVQDFIYDNKYIEIQDIFSKLFRTKGLLSDNKFNKAVWFLKDDIAFQNLIKHSLGNNSHNTSLGFSTPDLNTMHSILKELNEGEDFKRLSIQTRKFIEKVSEILVRCNLTIERSNNQILLYNAHLNKNILEETINILNTRISNGLKSFIKLKIGRIDLFPSGEYHFKINYSEIDQYDITLMNFKTAYLKDNKLLSIKQDKDIIILKNADSLNSFENIEFGSISISEENEISDKYEFSGSNLSSFNIIVQRNGKEFAVSKSDFFLDIFLSSIEELKDISKDSFETTWKVKLFQQNFDNNNNISNIKQSDEEFLVYLNIKIDFDPITRAAVLRRIKNIFTGVITAKAQNEAIINEILDKYFPEISESVKYSLAKKDQENHENCGSCNSCYLI